MSPAAPRTSQSGYAKRFARILEAVEMIAAHPEGMRLVDAAAALGAKPADLRAELLAYYTAEAAVGTGLDGYRLPAMSFLGPDGAEEDPHEAEVVVVSDPQQLRDIGVQRMSVAEAAQLWRSGQALLDVEPANAELASALRVLSTVWLGLVHDNVVEPGEEMVGRLRQAVQSRSVVRITYSRAWRPGVYDRDVHPYRVVDTMRGWELDAGPLDRNGMPRTYLLANTRAAQVLPATFERPAGVEKVIAANRAEREVVMVLPQDMAWTVDRLAERVDRMPSKGDEVEVRLRLAEPVADRVGLIICASQGGGMVVSPKELTDSGAEMARRLLAHHGLDLP